MNKIQNYDPALSDSKPTVCDYMKADLLKNSERNTGHDKQPRF